MTHRPGRDSIAPMRTRGLARIVVVVVALLLAGLVRGSGAEAAPVSLVLRPSVDQLYVLQATPGQALELVSGGAVVATGTVDAFGSLAWRDLTAGPYAVRVAGDPSTTSAPVTVVDEGAPPPPESFYRGQTVGPGFGYLTTRDGTTLSVNVVLPAGKGPYPTVVEYSGYDPSRPGTSAMAQLYTALGYAYVGVNIRGTGCSGGSFLSFEPVQGLDGYDAIETIAAQPWVKRHKVGMVGISYPGISQLYVARTRPPHLAAIAPLSVIDDTYRGTLYPGGILNTGFAVPWAKERTEQAAPYGQGWEKPLADAGDTTCAANQLLRLQNPDPLKLITDNPFYSKAVGDPITPALFADRIDVPVFIAGAWQDEQTGGHWPAILDDLTSAPHVYATLTNGSHTESLGLGVFGRYADFLDLYVGHRKPQKAKFFVAPVLAQSITGVKGLSLPSQPTYRGSYRDALRQYESQKPVRVLFEEGAADGQPSGAPVPRFEKSFSAWPIKQAKATAWYLTPGGGLSPSPSRKKPGQVKERSYRADPSALPRTTYSGSSSGIWRAHPKYRWKQVPRGKGLGWISPPLRKDVVAVGTGSVDLWVRSSAPDTDLEVTLSEVRPNGTEVYVQSGWLRASHRKLDTKASTKISPVHTDLESDARPLPRGRFTEVRVELFPFGQPFRAGSRLRLTVDAPGGARPLWAFDTIADGEKVTVATDRVHRSRIVLPVVAGVKVPAGYAPCKSLRSQPCRTYRG